MMSKKPSITNLAEALEEPRGNGARFEFRHRRLGPSLGLEKLACTVYVVPSGKSAFPYHAHAEIEEMFIILEGEGTLRHDGEEYPIREGDVIPAPLGSAHQIINTSTGDIRYLAVSSNDRTDVVTYPDSGKVMAYSTAFEKPLFHMSHKDDARDYYDGEK